MSKTQDKRKRNGGSREGAGRPRLFKSPVIMNFRVEEEDKVAVKELYKGELNPMFIEWIRELIKKKKS